MDRRQSDRCRQIDKILAFTEAEYEADLTDLRKIIADRSSDACILTSTHNVSYHSGFLYCAFGRLYGLIVNQTNNITLSARIYAAQPLRRCYGDNIVHNDWQRNNYWKVPKSIIRTGQTHSYEGDHVSIAQMANLKTYVTFKATLDN